MKMKVFLPVYFLMLGIALSFSSCEDDPISPTDPNGGNNNSDTTWVDDSTSYDPNGGGNNDSTWTDPNGGGYNDSTWTDPNGEGSNPGDSTGG